MRGSFPAFLGDITDEILRLHGTMPQYPVVETALKQHIHQYSVLQSYILCCWNSKRSMPHVSKP